MMNPSTFHNPAAERESPNQRARGDSELEPHDRFDRPTWDSAVETAVEIGAPDASSSSRSLSRASGGPRLGEPDGDRAEDVERGVAEIDLTESVVEEASLLDEESEALGEPMEVPPRPPGKRR